PMRVTVDGMKALFWVKDYVGNREFVARRDFDPAGRAEGRRAVLTFLDGETIWGSVTEDDPSSPGFFFIPSDDRDNNVPLFLVRTAGKEMRGATGERQGDRLEQSRPHRQVGRKDRPVRARGPGGDGCHLRPGPGDRSHRRRSGRGRQGRDQRLRNVRGPWS